MLNSLVSAMIIKVLLANVEAPPLARAVMNSAPHLTIAQAHEHVVAAKLAATKGISAELLLGMAYVGSRYIPFGVSRMERGRRMMGIPKWKSPPRYVTGPYFCGVSQVAAKMSWKRCLEFQDLNTSYRTSATELMSWVKMCRKIKKPGMRCALLGYGGGFPMIERGTSTYPNRVLRRAARLQKMTIEK